MFDTLNGTDRRVLEILWRTGEASRVEIAVATGLTKPAVTQVVKSLADHGLVQESAPRRGQRGQPARPVTIKPSAGFSAGVNFSHTYLEVVLVDLRGAPLGFLAADLPSPEPEEIAGASFAAVEKLIGETGLARSRCLGIGFSVPGDFMPDGGLNAHVYFPTLQGQKIRESLSRNAPFPVFVENDGKASAIGECILGAGRKARTFLVVHIGHGVGGGIVVNGSVYRGARGNAGPLGAFFPLGAPRPSGQDLLEHLQESGLDCPDFDSLHDLDPSSSGPLEIWIARASSQLESVLAPVASMLDPDLVVLAGRLPPRFLDAMAARIDLRLAWAPRDPLVKAQVAASSLGSRAGAVGAAMLPTHALLMPSGGL